MPMNKLFNALFILLLSFSPFAFSHSGSHGSDDCTLTIGDVELRLNSYQFQGSQPDRHYCRHFPYLGETIIKIDSVTSDLPGLAVEIQLLKRDSWLGVLFGSEDAFRLIKQQPIQYFSKQVVSIESDIQHRDLYAVKLRLHHANGQVIEQQFRFMVGFPFAHIMVIIALLLLCFIGFVFIRSLWLKGKQQ